MTSPLPWLEPDTPFPPPSTAWGENDPIPGLLAAGGLLDVPHLKAAYAQGTFPWFSTGQPVLWWAPHPRMVLPASEFKLRRSLRKTVEKFRADPQCEIRVNHAFGDVIRACANAPREGQKGTWIVPNMIHAYEQLHAAGHAHSIETWIQGQLAGGLYLVALGQAVFGESMFARANDASKIALAALVCLCRHHGVDWIDCQQNTPHLASLGAREVPRAAFLEHIQHAQSAPALPWKFEPLYWNELLSSPLPKA
ncbi:MAG: leucyl/phenylalanyl-tRNA--protein transferase [Burkholderiaceae bacterium]|nr:leucyl/phenylalanyl-tRNA--protein transferase [Burkholderiaceae bacterium]